MIIFEKVRYKNLLSVGNNFLEIDINSHKKTLVVGPNGNGKSSVLDAIVFGLYGKPFRKTNKPNIVNSINKSGLVVEIEFSIGKKYYKVVRGIKPNIFEIFCDDNLINQNAAAKDYQEYLEKYILRVNYKSFINVVILGSARYNPFMQMSASDRRSIIEELLGIQIFSTMNLLVKDKVGRIKEQISNETFNIELTKEKIDLQNQNIIEQKKNTKEQIFKKNQEIDKSNEQIEKLQSDVELIQKHIVTLQNKIVDKSSLDGKRNKMFSIESKLESALEKIKRESSFYQTNDNCPTCKQYIDDEFKNSQIQNNEKKQEELQEGLSKLEGEVSRLNQRLNEISEISDNIQEHQSEIVKINASINAIQNYIQKELKNISEISEVYDSIEDNNEKLQELLENLKQYNDNKDTLSMSKKYYDFAAVLLKDGGIKTRIIKQYLPIMNKLINTYLSHMNFFVNFNINENFEEVIKSRYRDEFRYENFSEGEKLRIDLAVLFAFRQVAKMKNSVNTNLILMDETLDGALDAEGCDLFLELISNLDNSTRIFVISHRQEQLSDKFDRTLKFEKKKNFTNMTQIN